MITLLIEEYGDGGLIRLDDEALSYLGGVGVGDTLIFDHGRVMVQFASGAMGDVFSCLIQNSGPANSTAT